MKVISSAQNPQYKNIVRLMTKSSVRKKENLIILDGIHLAKEYLNFHHFPQICIISDGSENNSEISEIVNVCTENDVQILKLTNDLFKKISSVSNEMSIIFLAKKPERPELRTDANTAILENIQDPGNLGTILRSASAAGVEQIICSENTVDIYSPKVLRAGMGAHFRLDILENQNLKKVIPELEIPVLATSLTAEKSIYDVDLAQNVAWIFGNEGAGLTEETQNLATQNVIIPQKNNVESLNVAMAATICFFEQMRQKL